MIQGMAYTEADASEWTSLIADDAWVAEQKMDGTRALIRVTRAQIEWFQRSGKPLGHTAATQHIAAINDELERLRLWADEVIVDGEVMIREGTLHLFDILLVVDNTVRLTTAADPLHYRRGLLEVAADVIDGKRVSVVRQARSRAEKEALMRLAESAGVEGLVFKRRDAAYQPGVRTKDVMKAKFVKTADVVVTGSTRSRNEAGREIGAFQFAVHDADGVLVPMGSCSAIGKPDAKVGDVIEVAYLYRDDSGGLVQPRMTRIREDKETGECDLSQFPAYSRAVVTL